MTFSDNDTKTLNLVCNWATNYSAPIGIIDPSCTLDGNIADSGTCSFLDTGTTKLIITNNHILQKYEELKSKNDDVRLRVFNFYIDPDKQLIDRNDKLDIVTFRVDENEVVLTGKIICSVIDWPPSRVKAGDSIVFSGYPGKFRKRTAVDKMKFEAVPLIESVTNVTDRGFSIQFDRSLWKKNIR